MSFPGAGLISGPWPARRRRCGPSWPGSAVTVGAGVPALAAGELRLLPLLPARLSFAEIAAGLFVSTNTAKTPAVWICRKLGAGSRGRAAGRARELGLLEGWAADLPLYR